MSPVSLRLDPWLGSHLGCTAAHLLLAGGQHVAEDIAAALAPLDGQRCFVDASVSVHRQDLLAACAGARMQLVDTNLRLERDMRRSFAPADAATAPARDATALDRSAVAQMAGTCLRWSRFHRDPRIGQATADALKAAWAANYFEGQRGDGMVVVDGPEGVAGFLLYLVRGTEMVIDLVTVAPQCRGRGLGGALIRAAAGRTEAATLVTGTQLVNVAAVGFYENMGFRLKSANHIFHYHGIPHEDRTL